jgi:hypothetical protein
VESPRSGTSILTQVRWSAPEYNCTGGVGWDRGLGVALAIGYQTKTALGNRSLLSRMNVQREEFLAAFGQTINALILRHSVDLERKGWEQAAAPNTHRITS